MVIISGGDPANLGSSEAIVYRNELILNGLPACDLLLESQSLNTSQNAQFTSALIRERGLDNAVLATSGLHMKRAMLYFAHFQVCCQAAPADQVLPVRCWVPLGLNLALADLALNEHLGILRYQWYNRLGWNASTPGNPGGADRSNP
ncbi:MAG: YdcF family protein [Holophaga sp.]|jgi:uncharacterized SAM-binding protein YcdF (DUF218 family)